MTHTLKHTLSSSFVEINLSVIQRNAKRIFEFVNRNGNNNKNNKNNNSESVTRLMPVVKANAYGHGAVQVARALLEMKEVDLYGLAVNRVLEGVELRQQLDIHDPPRILVLGYANVKEVVYAAEHRLTPTVGEREQILALEGWACQRDATVSVHVKVDSGMGRFGLLPAELDDFVDFLMQSAPHVRVEGLFTHLSSADEMKHEDSVRFTKSQIDAFVLCAKRAQKKLGYRVTLHCANSAGTLFHPESHLDMVRPGGSIFGLHPSNNWSIPLPVEIEPALTWRSSIARLRTLKAGSPIGYGRTYMTPKNGTGERIALIPVGYGDGYARNHSNRGNVLVNGKRCPIRGNVCMDQFMISVDHLLESEVHLDDEVVLVGKQGEKGALLAEEVSKTCQANNYAITTSLLNRIPRIYTRDGIVVEEVSLCDEGKRL